MSALTEAPATVVTSEGVYDMPADVYHADPVPAGSISSSGARKLLATCPARYRYEADNPPKPTKAMELGTAAHKLVLGIGPELHRMSYDTYRSGAAQAERDAAYDRGAVPLKPDEYDQVEEMAAAIREHELASVLLGGTGEAERALFWKDGPTKVWRRALLDWLPPKGPDGRLYLADYKTADSAHPDAISKSLINFGYHMQGAWYEDAVRALGLSDAVPYFLVVQEKTAPYIVSVVQLTQIALDAGRHENRKALRLFARCQKAGHWPPYIESVAQVGLPGWAENRFLQEVTS
ncbi:PD-(D/E)XK nuclease-like domain-containing protein [Actinomadura litoris]|uniref:PD-(D/E)XK nuclease-like domain-containing protein n=1 Tax=Actinomadura litoris TaxID=2678616 RepID=UPI001566FE3B|nr:PD-(D/E)XK nuclease-like domain-containing protein [Actinomadura litoris]